MFGCIVSGRLVSIFILFSDSVYLDRWTRKTFAWIDRRKYHFIVTTLCGSFHASYFSQIYKLTRFFWTIQDLGLFARYRRELFTCSSLTSEILKITVSYERIKIPQSKLHEILMHMSLYFFRGGGGGGGGWVQGSTSNVSLSVIETAGLQLLDGKTERFVKNSIARIGSTFYISSSLFPKK